MRLRKQKRQPQVLSDDLLPQFHQNGHLEKMPADWTSRADHQFENRELGNKIQEAIAKLPEKYRIILMMRDVEGLSNEEIGHTLGLSVPAVKSILHRSRLFLREELNQYFEKR